MSIRYPSLFPLLAIFAALACDSGVTNEAEDSRPPDVDIEIPVFAERGRILYAGESVPMVLFAWDESNIREIRVQLSIVDGSGARHIREVIYSNIHDENPFMIEATFEIPHALLPSSQIVGRYAIGVVAVDGSGHPYGESGTFELRRPD